MMSSYGIAIAIALRNSAELYGATLFGTARNTPRVDANWVTFALGLFATWSSCTEVSSSA